MFKFLSSFILVSIIVFPLSPVVVSAQSACTSVTTGKSRSQLEAELEACNKEIAEWTKTLNQTKQQSASFQRDIGILTAKINAAQANIKAKNLAITNLSRDIAVRESKISALNQRIQKGKDAIAEILRKTSELNSYSLPEAILSDKALSEFFVDIDAYASTEEALDNLFEELRYNKKLTEAEKLALSKKKEAEASAKATIEAAKREVEIAQKDKKTLLAVSQTNEKTYAQVLADRQAKAAQIRAVLFPLRDSGPIPFGTALQYAQNAGAKTGVRPAFILGIFATESGKGSDGTFGGNVGQCLLTNSPNKGDGKGKNTGTPFSQVMKGSRDVDPFIEITQELGRDPFSQPVSCPQSYGFGGAMGPAQFIASTWKGMKPRIASATGKTAPDPWDPADAFMAAALYLSDLGASRGTYEAERVAACRYNGGGTSCTSVTSGYGTTAMKNATRIQQDIDFLQGL